MYGAKGKRNRMKRPNAMKWLVIGILALTILSVVLTVLVLKSHEVPIESKPPTPKIETLSNVYITSCDNKEITFLYEGNTYTKKGTLETPFTGVADIVLKKGKVARVFQKTDYITGRLLSYDSNRIEIEGYGYVDSEEYWSIYRDYGDVMCTITANDLVIGASNLNYYVANNKICAIVQTEETSPTEIRILMKNGTENTYQSLWVKGDDVLTVGEQSFAANTPVDVVSCFASQPQANSLCIRSQSGFVYAGENAKSFGEVGYEGSLQVRKLSDGQMVLLSVVPMETYVSYVLPSEMPPSFSYEALKAQAVCARTFAYEQITNQTYANYGANLDNTTAFQVYHAVQRNAVCDLAVAETEGQILMQDGRLITCYYYSTNPGVGTNPIVWGQKESAYLAEASYLLEKESKQPESFFVALEDLDLATPEGFSLFIHSLPSGLDSASAFYRWTATLDVSKLCDEKLGKVKELRVTNRSSAGYVTELLVTYDKGSRILYKENEIRQFLGKGLVEIILANQKTRTDLVSLPSACFEISQVEKDSYTLTGGGFGHGIGMSQYGADALGKMGYTYEQILSTYYRDVELVHME